MAKIATATEPLSVPLTANTWIKVLEADGSNPSIYMENEDTSTELRYQFPDRNNPFCFDFVTTTNINATAMLSAPNTWASATEGTMVIRFRADAHAGARYLFSFGDTNADEHLSLWIDDDEKINATCVQAGAAQWTFKSDTAIVANSTVWYKVALIVRKRTPANVITPPAITPRLEVDGEEVPITFSVTTDKTKFMSVLSGVDNAYIGQSNFNSGGNSDQFEGQIDYARVFDNSNRDSLIVLNYELDEGTGTVATDSGLYGDNGTITVGSGGWAARSNGTKLAAGDARVASIEDGDRYIRRAMWAFTTGSGKSIELTKSGSIL